MRTYLLLIILQLFFAGIVAQNNHQKIGLIDEFDCRIDSFKITYSKSSLNELRIFSYNPDGQIVAIERLSAEAHLPRTPFERTLFSYDENNHQTEVQTDTYNASLGLWVRSKKDETSYDSQHRISSQAAYKWNESSKNWVGEGLKTAHDYLSDNVHEMINYEFNSSKNAWIETSKSRTERETDHRTICIYYDFESSQFVEKSKSILEISNDGLSEVETCYEKNNDWTPIFRRSTTYNAESRQSTETTETYTSEVWTPIYRHIVSYNNAQEVSSIQESYFDFNMEQWVMVKDETYQKQYADGFPNVSIGCVMGNVKTTTQLTSTKKDDGIELQKIRSYADGAPSELQSTVRVIYKEGTLKNFSIEDGVTSNGIRSDWNWYMNAEDGYLDVNYHSLSNPYSCRFYISEIGRVPTPIVPDDTLLRLKIYPNPVEDILTIEHRCSLNQPVGFVLYDINGKIVRKGALDSNATQLNLSNLSSGVYLMNVRFGDRQPNSKVIIKK